MKSWGNIASLGKIKKDRKRRGFEKNLKLAVLLDMWTYASVQEELYTKFWLEHLTPMG